MDVLGLRGGEVLADLPVRDFFADAEVTAALARAASGALDLPGAMFTASHNPAQYNGIKLCRAGARPVSLETGLAEMRDLAQWALDRGQGVPFDGAAGSAFHICRAVLPHLRQRALALDFLEPKVGVVFLRERGRGERARERGGDHQCLHGWIPRSDVEG